MSEPSLSRIVVDLDNTLCGPKPPGGTYADCPPRHDVIARLRALHDNGTYVIVQSARQMRTYAGNIGKVNVDTLPVILDWLTRHGVPHDEVHVGKPWCGFDGYYVDDRAIRPSEFVTMTDAEITELLAKETS